MANRSSRQKPKVILPGASASSNLHLGGPKAASLDQRNSLSGKCLGCGRTDVRLTAAHIIPRFPGEKDLDGPEDRVKVDCDHEDCVIGLCASCHKKFDGASPGRVCVLAEMFEPFMEESQYDVEREALCRGGPATYDGLLLVTRKEFKPKFDHAMNHLERLTLDFTVLRQILVKGTRVFREDPLLQAKLLEIRAAQKSGALRRPKRIR